jgi:hypothetical protein
MRVKRRKQATWLARKQKWAKRRAQSMRDKPSERMRRELQQGLRLILPHLPADEDSAQPERATCGDSRLSPVYCLQCSGHESLCDRVDPISPADAGRA